MSGGDETDEARVIRREYGSKQGAGLGNKHTPNGDIHNYNPGDGEPET